MWVGIVFCLFGWFFFYSLGALIRITPFRGEPWDSQLPCVYLHFFQKLLGNILRGVWVAHVWGAFEGRTIAKVKLYTFQIALYSQRDVESVCLHILLEDFPRSEERRQIQIFLPRLFISHQVSLLPTFIQMVFLS